MVGLERVPLVDVAVHEHRALVVVRDASPLGARERMRNCPLGTRPIGRFPCLHDVVGEPDCLLGAGGEPAVGCRAPESHRGRAEDLVAFLDRRREIEQRRAETFQQERTPFGIVAQQAHTTFAVREPQRRDLVGGGVDSRAE